MKRGGCSLRVVSGGEVREVRSPTAQTSSTFAEQTREYEKSHLNTLIPINTLYIRIIESPKYHYKFSLRP